MRVAFLGTQSTLSKNLAIKLNASNKYVEMDSREIHFLIAIFNVRRMNARIAIPVKRSHVWNVKKGLLLKMEYVCRIHWIVKLRKITYVRVARRAIIKIMDYAINVWKDAFAKQKEVVKGALTAFMIIV